MTIRNLGSLFRPQSIAVVGASLRPGSIGAMVWSRVLASGFTGPVWPVNPKYDVLTDRVVFADVSELLEAPGVALICTPPSSWPAIVGKLGKLGTRAAILIGEAKRPNELTALARALAAARPYLLRIIGPGSIGVATPTAQLGALAFSVKAGGVAWISQSNALTNAVLGWAYTRDLGFSHVVALGDEADVDLGDVLDYLASDSSTRAILLEVESIRSARKFMSAARAAARNKPVLALRSGRLNADDALYSAAFRRAGIVRVDALDDLLDEIETLGVGMVAASSMATLITSDRGVAIHAADAFAAAGDTLAQWPQAAASAVIEALPHLAPSRNVHGDLPGNPLRLGDDARPRHFGTALKVLAAYPETGTALVVHAPTHSAPVTEVARVLIEHKRYAYRGLLACFFGGVDAATRDALHAEGIPVHTTPQRLAGAFARLVEYRLGRELLMQTPGDSLAQIPGSIEAAQTQIRNALNAGCATVSGADAARLVESFGLTVLRDAPSQADEAVVDILIELHDDANFGPVFRFTVPSMDGVSAPMRVYGLPPLNPVLAREIMSHSPYAQRFPIKPALGVLRLLSRMVCCVTEIVGLSVTLRVTPTRTLLMAPCLTLAATRSRLAIMPYPRHLKQTFDWRGQRMTLRPIRPEDEQAHRAFIDSMTPSDLRMRFFGAIRNFDHSQLARLTQIDYDREMALILTDAGKPSATLGVVRVMTEPDNETAEFALAVRSDLKGQGLGRLLMTRIIEYVRSRGTHWIVGEALAANAPMIRLAKACGFTVSRTDEPGVLDLRLALGDTKA